jgi:dephospho-CoA kinase
VGDLPNIAFIGKAGSGKDTAASLLIEQFDYERLAFADALKDVAEGLWGTEARTDRDKLQRLGEYVRRIDEDTWVNVALRSMGDGEGLPWAVTDCRYKNEAWRLKGEDFVIVRVVADRNKRIARLRTMGKLGPAGWEDHVSETDLDDWPADYEIMNLGSKADLLEQLAQVIRAEQGAVAP